MGKSKAWKHLKDHFKEKTDKGFQLLQSNRKFFWCELRYFVVLCIYCNVFLFCSVHKQCALSTIKKITLQCMYHQKKYSIVGVAWVGMQSKVHFKTSHIAKLFIAWEVHETQDVIWNIWMMVGTASRQSYSRLAGRSASVKEFYSPLLTLKLHYHQ